MSQVPFPKPYLLLGELRIHILNRLFQELNEFRFYKERYFQIHFFRLQRCDDYFFYVLM